MLDILCCFSVSNGVMERDRGEINGRCDKYSPQRASVTFMSQEDIAAGKKSQWNELEITGEAYIHIYVD